MTKTKILVTGASGFIGRNILESLMTNPNYEVSGTYFKSDPQLYPNARMIYADLTRKEDVDRVVKGMDIVIQCAATTSGSKDVINKPYYHVTDNAMMNSLVFRATHENKVSHVIFFSCTTMYRSSDQPLTEEDFNEADEMVPAYFGVGWTKVYIEKMCEFYSRISDTKYSVLRHSNVYGKYDKFDLERSHVFGATITKVLDTPEGGTITVWGEGKEERDLLYIDDLVDFVNLAIEKQKNKFELYNVGYGSSISIADLVKKIIHISGKNLSIQYDKTKPNINTKLCLCSDKAKRSLGWVPKVSLDEGIRLTMDWRKEKL